MGIFSQDKTTTNQTAYNQQVTASNRDLSGTQNQLGAISPGRDAAVNITTLDQKALQTAAFTINHAIDANSAATQANLTGFQNALSVVSEHQQSAADLATGQQQTVAGKIGFSPQQIVLGIAAVFGGLFLLRRYAK